jgi:HAD superfamily hydrolase (TIGR01509 family)
MQGADERWEKVRSAPRGVIFDFEGTLVDFQWKLEEGESELRKGFATLDIPETELADRSYSTMWNLAVSRFAESELRIRVGPIYDRYDLDALSRWRLREGAARMLVALKERGLRVGLVSNIGHCALDPAFERFGLVGSFDTVIARDDVVHMKPHPEGILRCLAGWSLDPGEALFVGDSRTDIRASRAAGVRVAIVAGGESSEADLAAMPPDDRLASLDEVLGLV